MNVMKKKQKISRKLLTCRKEPHADLTALLTHPLKFLAAFEHFLCARYSPRLFLGSNSLASPKVDSVLIIPIAQTRKLR